VIERVKISSSGNLSLKMRGKVEVPKLLGIYNRETGEELLRARYGSQAHQDLLRENPGPGLAMSKQKLT
jgi:hypothetical protein